jgi:5'-3' exonuclease
MSEGPVLVLDTASLYYRSFYALPDSMKSPDGRPHQAVRGFLTMLDAFHTRFNPTAIIACWDVDWRPQWRVDLLPSYKTHRVLETTDQGGYLEDEPDTLAPQIQAIAQILDSSSIARVGVDHYEADDVAATLAHSIPGSVIVISGDRDMVQVVDDEQQVRLFLAVNGGMPAWPLLDEQAVIERYGVSSQKYVDFAIMRGDPSDGIPGVPGIGEKTAAALITAFGDLRGIMAAAQEPPVKPLTPRIATLLRDHADVLEISQQVATAVRTAVSYTHLRAHETG